MNQEYSGIDPALYKFQVVVVFSSIDLVCPWWFYNSESSGHILTIMKQNKVENILSH